MYLGSLGMAKNIKHEHLAIRIAIFRNKSYSFTSFSFENILSKIIIAGTTNWLQL